ncbi:YihY/virulence factor BrkB family protein [Haloprofundus marisrubri]|uniref:YihY/virulence factor BrkB family protein n=1 Tax=Haloprofundus marisrubri TaxID=1514971 RepID=UPI0008F93232|nr:YihY/virulence factor BrkB family protein [Haloprofundus marisrubri]
MHLPAGETTATVKATVQKVRDENLTFLAGSLAYNAFVSLIPLLLLLLLAAGTIGDEALTRRITVLTNEYLTPNAQELVTEAVTNTSGQTGLSVLGVLVLLWGALKLFRGLDVAFAEVYNTTDELSFLGQLRHGFVAFVTVAVSLFAVGLAGGVFAYLQLPFLHVLNPLLLLCGLSLAFLPMYYVFPSVDVRLAEALPGAVVAAGGWALLEIGFQLYAANAGQYEAYGVIGGVLLLVTWLYFSGLVLLVGAAVNAVIWEQRYSAEFAPPDHADSTAPTVSTTPAAPTSSSDRTERTSEVRSSHLLPSGSDDTSVRAPSADEPETALDADDAEWQAGSSSSSSTGSRRDENDGGARSFLLGVGVGICGCVALSTLALWRLVR